MYSVRPVVGTGVGAGVGADVAAAVGAGAVREALNRPDFAYR
jgi:hypothetical protein